MVAVLRPRRSPDAAPLAVGEAVDDSLGEEELLLTDRLFGRLLGDVARVPEGRQRQRGHIDREQDRPGNQDPDVQLRRAATGRARRTNVS